MAHMEGGEGYPRAEEMLKMALDGYDRSLGKEHEDTTRCAKNLAVIYARTRSEAKVMEVVKEYPSVLEDLA